MTVQECCFPVMSYALNHTSKMLRNSDVLLLTKSLISF